MRVDPGNLAGRPDRLPDPDGAVPGDDRARRPAERDRRRHVLARRVDPRDRLRAGTAHPDIPAVDSDAGRVGTDGNLRHEPVTARVDEADRAGRDRRQPGRAAGRRHHRRGDTGGDEQRAAGGEQEQAAAASRPVRGTPGRGALESRVVLEDLALQRTQLRPRLETQLLVESPLRLPVGIQRVRLPARAVEGEHQLATQPLTERMGGDERLQLGHGLGVPALELGVDSLLDCEQPQLFEAGDVGLRRLVVTELGEGIAAEQLLRPA
jgi:hypothetical protein